MSLMQRAKQDIQGILANTGEFALPLVFEAPTGETLETTGQFFDRTLEYESNQTYVTGAHAVVHVSEQPFTDAGYPIRRADDLVAFLDHLVTATYADGTVKTMKVFDSHPDYSINMITLQLQHYVAD